MPDKFAGQPDGLTIPCNDGMAVTPSDVTVFDQPSKLLYIGDAGSIVVRTIAGTTLTFSSVADGTLLPLRVDQVLATGTLATGIFILF